MFTLLIVIVCVSNAFAQKCECGVEDTNERIIGGELVQVNKHPWMAFVLITTPEGVYQCGGAIISDQTILTAAHCLHEALSANVSVGSIYDASNSTVLEVEHAYIHGRYNHSTHNHDIALLHLKQPLQFSDSIRSICLPTANMDVTGSLNVAGWGLTETGESSNRLVETTVYEYPYDVCNREWNGTLTKWQFCAMSDRQDTCGGDGGGPAIRKWRGKSYAVGIVSLGDVYCKGTKKSLYTRVTSYLKWIARHTKRDVFCT